jgi:hypothetical protein
MNDPFIFANNSFFSKIRSINYDRDGFMCQTCAKMSKFIPFCLNIPYLPHLRPNKKIKLIF